MVREVLRVKMALLEQEVYRVLLVEMALKEYKATLVKKVPLVKRV
jgi:hypothetical protein